MTSDCKHKSGAKIGALVVTGLMAFGGAASFARGSDFANLGKRISRPAGGGVSLARLARSFRLFNQPPRALGTAGNLAPTIDPFLVHVFGVDTADARQVHVNGSESAWIYPGTYGSCIHMAVADPLPRGQVVGIGVCNSSSQVLSGSLRLYNPHAVGGSIVVGLVPNNIAEVSVDLTDGTRLTVPVVENVYSVVLGNASATSTQLEDSTGGVVRTLSAMHTQ